jgi:hypothetical protein
MSTDTAHPADPPAVAAQLGSAVQELLRWLHEVAPHQHRDNEVVALVAAHLGEGRRSTSVVVRDVPPFEQVNLQVALDAWIAEPGRDVVVHGLALNEQYGPTGLQDIVHGEVNGPLQLSAPDVVDLPSGPDRTHACWRRALLLVQDERGAYVVMLRGPQRHEPSMDVQVAGLPTAQAQEVHRELAELRSTLNVYRGQLLEMQGDGTIEFPVLPATAREDVVLPDRVLRRVERHTVDIAARRAELRAAGQHLKRGLLLYGPPGTGKTHTTRYLVQRLAGTTVFLLSGRALPLIGMVTELARELQPSAVVLEDVDLVAEDRGYGDGASPCSSSCSTPWTARRPTPTCCSCSRRTAPTCSSRRSPRGRAAWTSPSRSTCRSRTPAAGCSTSTAGACRSPSSRPTSTRSSSAPRA